MSIMQYNQKQTEVLVAESTCGSDIMATAMHGGDPLWSIA